MKAARIRFYVILAIFVGWLGYLGFLALGNSKPVLVSRSQMLVAPYWVKAEVALDDTGKPIPEIRVRESFGSRPLQEGSISVDNLAAARLPGNKPISSTGTYLLPLERLNADKFRVVSAPNSQGFESSSRMLWVYPWNTGVEQQIRDQLPNAK